MHSWSDKKRAKLLARFCTVDYLLTVWYFNHIWSQSGVGWLIHAEHLFFHHIIQKTIKLTPLKLRKPFGDSHGLLCAVVPSWRAFAPSFTILEKSTVKLKNEKNKSHNFRKSCSNEKFHWLIPINSDFFEKFREKNYKKLIGKKTTFKKIIIECEFGDSTSNWVLTFKTPISYQSFRKLLDHWYGKLSYFFIPNILNLVTRHLARMAAMR